MEEQRARMAELQAGLELLGLDAVMTDLNYTATAKELELLRRAWVALKAWQAATDAAGEAEEADGFQACAEALERASALVAEGAEGMHVVQWLQAQAQAGLQGLPRGHTPQLLSL